MARAKVRARPWLGLRLGQRKAKVRDKVMAKIRVRTKAKGGCV